MQVCALDSTHSWLDLQVFVLVSAGISSSFQVLFAAGSGTSGQTEFFFFKYIVSFDLRNLTPFIFQLR